MSVQTMLLSKEQLACVVNHNERRNYYGMHYMQVLPNGTSQTTNGKALLRVLGPRKADRTGMFSAEDDTLRESVLIDARTCAKAVTLLQKGEMARLEVEKGKQPRLVFVGPHGETVTIEFAEPSNTRFPDCDGVWKDYSRKDPKTGSLLDVNLLMRTLASLKKAGVRQLRVEQFEASGGLVGIRLTGYNFGCKKVCGVLMPLTDSAHPVKEEN